MKKNAIMLFEILFILVFATVVYAEEKCYLSDNSFLQKDIQLYENIGVSLKQITTGATYAWTEDSDAQIISNDSSNSKLIGGDVQNFAAQYCTDSSWNASKNSSAVFDLKEKYEIDRVDVWSSSNRNQQMGELNISVSDDGITYRSVGSWQAEIPSSDNMNSYGQALGHTVCEFTKVTARYVKVTGKRASVTITGAPCRQYVFNEIIIFGQEHIENAPTLHLYFSDLMGETLYAYAGERNVCAKADVPDSDAELITAWYGIDGKLKNLVKKTARCSNANNPYSVENKIDLSEWANGDYLKSFLFDSFNNVKPLTESISLKERIDEQGIISGNTTDGNVLVYPVSKGYSLVTTGDYASSDRMIGNEYKIFDGDTETSVLIDGECGYANMNIHFDAVMQISEVDIYAMCANDSYMAEYDIYSSIDGVNYTYVATKTNTISKSLNRILKVKLSINDVLYAKHIKLIIKRDTELTKMLLSEIEVYGKFPAFSKERETDYDYEDEAPFKTSEDIVLQDSEKNILSDANKTNCIETTGEYISLIYALDDYKQVEEAVIYGSHSGCELLTSPDGENYFTIGFYPQNDGVTKVCGKSYNNSKFVKIVIRKGDLEKIRLSEIELYTRKLYTFDGVTNVSPEKVNVRTYIKPNNILYLDWSGYNHKRNGASSYKVFIEENNFTSTGTKMPKDVFFTDEQFCVYAGLEPDKDYYIAILPITSNYTSGSVTTKKIHTYSALGGEKLSGIFCINEYPYGGGSHVPHDDEESNLNNKLKLLADLEVLSKTRYWQTNDVALNKYIRRGLSFHIYGNDEVSEFNSHGIYTFGCTNEPDLSDTYKNDQQRYIDTVVAKKQKIKNANERNLLCEPQVCGTDKLDWVESLYKTDSNFGNYYDVFDIHAYCKIFEGRENLEDNIASTSEALSVPEHLFAKVERIHNLLSKYGDDDKDLIFTEIGWSTHTLKPSQEYVSEAVTPKMQADFTSRCYLVSAALGIKNVFLYAFQDESYETTSAEYQYGIVDWYGNPKPAYYAYYTLGKLLKEAKFVKKIDDLSHPNYGMIFYDNEKDMYLTALWNISGSGDTVTITSDDARMIKVDTLGNSEYITNGNINVNSSPIYIYSNDIPVIL